MPDAFFASNKQRKRKRSNTSDSKPSSSKKPNRSAIGQKKSAPQPASKRAARDEELSDETNEGDDNEGIDDMDLRAPDEDPNAYGSGEEDEDETPAEKRLRLAKLYLESVKQGLSLAEGEFDAAEIDRELISARLKQDVMEHSGKVHLFVADSFDLSDTPTLRTRGHRFCVTGAVASQNAQYLYTSSKDGSIIKWNLLTGKKLHTFPKVRSSTKGKGKAKAKDDEELQGHTDEIWAIALSPDGKLLASGGKDRKVGVWDVEKNVWVKGFSGHRDSISALAFRKLTPSTTNPTQLYTASYDRTLKLFDLSPQTMGYVETLFGHQAPVLALDTLLQETAVSVGGRDKTVRYWKVPEESQLVFRGGGRSGWEDVLAEGGEIGDDEAMDVDGDDKSKTKKRAKGKVEKFIEGSIECVAMIDESTFVSGGDSGSISLWSTQKKKPVFTQALAHGMDESNVDSLEDNVEMVRKPRWITALGCLRYSDLFASGSWDNSIRLWKLDSKLRSFSLIGTIPAIGVVNTIQLLTVPSSTQLSWPQPEHSQSETVTANDSVPKGSVLLVAGVGTETKMGRWIEKKREQGCLNGALAVVIKPRTTSV
ncbi:Ribosomal RNA-processing protein Rrp9-like protein [Abortiporus biennis]